MIRTKDIEKIIALTLASAYVEGDKPASLMIVSERPESGKTDMVQMFSENTGIVVLSDVTAFALWRDFYKEITARKIKHIIIPEFLAPLTRSSAIDNLIATFQMMIEEGLTEIHTGFLPSIKFDTPISIGLIICMPRNAYVRHKLSWETSGFLSRFLVATYSYDKDTIEAIFKSIIQRQYFEKSKIKFAFTSATIEIPVPIAEMCRGLAESITSKSRQEGKLYGFRELKNILRFIASNVIIERANGSKRTVATKDDFDEVSRLSYLFNENFNHIKSDNPIYDTEIPTIDNSIGESKVVYNNLHVNT